MKKTLKKCLDKYKNNILSFVTVLLFLPLFTITSYAYDVEYLSYPWLGNGKVYYGTKMDTVLAESYEMTKNSLNIYTYEFGSTSALTVNQLFFGNDLYEFLYPYDNTRYTYKFVGAVVMDYSVGNFNPNTVMLDDIVIHQFNNANIINSSSAVNLSVDKQTVADGVVFNFNFDLPSYNTLNVLEFKFNPSGVYTSRETSRLKVTGSVIAIPIDNNGEGVEDAIRDQTTIIGGLIDEGNNSTGGIVDGNNDAIGNLDSVIEDYRETEQVFFDDFTANQQAITSDIVGWSWGGLVNCANWVGETMTDYYNSMGDFRQYIIYPLMLGIALFFLGRGGSIIGHLFRKPTETTVNTKSVTRRDGNTRYTTTTTSRRGGVWRK